VKRPPHSTDTTPVGLGSERTAVTGEHGTGTTPVGLDGVRADFVEVVVEEDDVREDDGPR
jgi:hypothetical protein